MAEPLYFIVTRDGRGGEVGAVFAGHVPEALSKRRAGRVLYRLRLDTIPQRPIGECSTIAEVMRATWDGRGSLAEMMRLYRDLRDCGKLPQNAKPPTAASAGTRIGFGMRDKLQGDFARPAAPSSDVLPREGVPKHEHWIKPPVED